MRSELSITTLFALLTDYGRFGPLAGPSVSLLDGSEVSYLSVATHWRRRLGYPPAAQNASIAFALDPDSPATLWVSGLILGGRWESQGDLAKAALERLAELNPLATEAYVVMALQAMFVGEAARNDSIAKLEAQNIPVPVVDAMRALRFCAQGWFVEAGQLLAPYSVELKLSENPEFAGRDWWARLAETYADPGQCAAALKPWFAAEPAVELAIRLATAQTLSGLSYEAVTVLDSVADKASSHQFFAARAKAKRFAGRLPESQTDYDSAIAANFDGPSAARDRSQLLLERAELELQQSKNLAAIATVDQAIELQPKNAKAYLQRGHLRQTVLRYAEAAADFVKALELDAIECPLDVFASIATCLFNARRYEAAATYYLKAITVESTIALDSRSPEMIAGYWEHRGVCFHFLNKLSDAVDCYTEALKLMPTLGKSFSDRGEALLALHRDDAAIIDLDRALELGYKIGCTMLAKGEYFQRKNQHTKALAALDEAVNLWPTSPLPFEARAKTREALANHRGARDDRESAAVIRASKKI